MSTSGERDVEAMRRMRLDAPHGFGERLYARLLAHAIDQVGNSKTG